MNRELKKDLFNIYDVIVFEDENGITQDCVCAIGKDKEVDEAVGVVDCNNHSISICENGSYKVWEKDGKDMPYYATNKKIIHLYTLKNDNRYYEIYPTNDYEYYIFLDKAESSEALECLKALQSIRDKYSMPLTEYVNSFDYIKTIKQVLIKQQEQEKKNAEYKQLEEQLGCPLDIYAKIQSGLVDVIYVKRYETVRKYWDENGLQLEQKECLVPRSITRVERRYFYYQDILGKEDMYFSKYGTEFWLKEDKSE